MVVEAAAAGVVSQALGTAPLMVVGNVVKQMVLMVGVVEPQVAAVAWDSDLEAHLGCLLSALLALLPAPPVVASHALWAESGPSATATTSTHQAHSSQYRSASWRPADGLGAAVKLLPVPQVHPSVALTPGAAT